MAAPVLTTLSQLAPASRAGLPALSDGASVEHFAVLRDGACPAGSWAAGEVLVCRGEPRDGDTVVLVARGHGRPRIGQVIRGQLIGDAGERCHPERWRVAGRVVGTWRRRVEGWVCGLVEAGEVVAPVAAPARQLGLFEVAA